MGSSEWKVTLVRFKMSSGPQSTRISPRKFSEKIALLNKKEREANAKFEQIINEVHSSIGQPQQARKQPLQHQQQPQSTLDSARLGLQFTSDELQAMIESTRYQAAHSDSLEEIERVYENLMRSVGQCDLPSSQQQQQQQQQFVARTTANSAHSASNTTISTSFNGPFYQRHPLPPPPHLNNQFHSTNIDLNNNGLSHRSGASQSANYIPCERAENALHTGPTKGLFSAHNVLDTCVSTSYLPHAIQQQQQQQQPDVCMPDSQTRGRVVSFGSASRDRFRAGPIIQHHQQHHQQQQQQQQLGANLQADCHGHQLKQNQRQYLEEPASDRCRQKSCSDPQLNVLAPAQESIGPMEACKSDKRLAVSSALTSTPFECCANTGADQLALKSSAAPNSNLEYFLATDGKVEPARQTAQVSTTSGIHFEPCDTTQTRTGELPGIKICTIGDNSGPQFGSAQQRQVFSGGGGGGGGGEAPSRDSSLPDISNLQFNNGSAGTSPEKHHQHQYGSLNKRWPAREANNQSCCPVEQNGGAQMGAEGGGGDSCELAANGSWQHYEMGQPAEVKMEVTQTADQLLAVSSSEARESAPWPESGQQQQHAPKTANNLSSSDYAFNTSSGSHHQQGNLMICTSSELYNNLLRSRSHSNIDYLAKQPASAKRPHLYADNLAQFEEHHTSQYCLQTAERPVMNVRRIAELKAQGTSTSPLNSSSNLNSPQSDANSPGSSTTEQCDSALLFAGNPSQQSFYQVGGPSVDTDPTHFVGQYAPDCRALAGAQQRVQFESTFESSNQCAAPLIRHEHQATPVRQLCQPSTTSPAGLFDQPSSNTADGLDYVNNER